MKEKTLKDYLDDKVNVDILVAELKSSRRTLGDKITEVHIEDINESGEYEITRQHLVKLCDDTIAKNLDADSLNTIAFAFISSEYFIWDNETVDGRIVSDTISDWDNTEIGFPLTIDNVRRWKAYLLTGEYKFG